jgi:uncharacterized protein involved in exopolysaccharide biosynthesis
MQLQEFVEYMRIVFKRWWLLLILCGVTLGSIWISFRAAPPRYMASVQFLVNAPPSSNVALYPGTDSPSQNQQIAATQAAFIEILKSPTVIQRTAKRVMSSKSSDELSRQITVDQPLKSEFVRLSVLGNSPQEAADLANTLLDTAKQYYGQIQSEPAASSREFISKQVQDASRELEAAKQALADFRRDHRVSALPDEIAAQRSIVWNLVLEKGKASVAEPISRLPTYDQLISDNQAELQRLTGLSDEYESLQDKIKRADAYYGFLVDKETEAKLKENEVLRTSYIQVVEPAVPPKEAVSPFDIKVFVLGGALSLVITTVLAFVLEYLESRPKAAQDKASTYAMPS